MRNMIKRLSITAHLYLDNGLANHAAACAYGFLLSTAPMLLLIAFILFMIFERSPGAITALINNIPFISELFDEKWFTSEIFSRTKFGVSGVIGIISILWATRIMAQSIQRGLKTIFPSVKARNPFKDYLVTMSIEAFIVIFVLMAIVSSRTAVHLYRLFDFLPKIPILNIVTSFAGTHISYVFLLGIVSFCLYLFVPVNPPRKFPAFCGALFCVFFYGTISMILAVILDITRYNFLYGALGNLVVLLINVFFFFSFFMMGAQLAFVMEAFKEMPSLLDIIKKKNIDFEKAANEYKFTRL